MFSDVLFLICAFGWQPWADFSLLRAGVTRSHNIVRDETSDFVVSEGNPKS